MTNTNEYENYHVVDGKVIVIGGDEEAKPSSYEDLLIAWLKVNTPPAVDTKTISSSINVPYDTLQPKLKKLADTGRIILTKEARKVGQIGRRKYLWSYS